MHSMEGGTVPLSTHPVLSAVCSLLKALLQPLPHASCFLEVCHQLPGALQLLLLHDGLQHRQVAVARLLQGWHRQAWQPFLMGEEAARKLGRRNRPHQGTGFLHPHFKLGRDGGFSFEWWDCDAHWAWTRLVQCEREATYVYPRLLK